MGKKRILILLFLFLATSIKAQDSIPEANGYKLNNNFDLALSFSGEQFSTALSWVHFYNVSKNKKFKIGYGLRFTLHSGKDLYYQTAPAELTSGKSGPLVIFSDTKVENIDSVLFPSTQLNLINASINLQYSLSKKVEVGFNIDAIGFSFGKDQVGKYVAYQSADNGSTQSATPSSFNLLLVSDNDKGSLNSEFYIRYWFNNNWGIRAGGTFLFTEYTTDNKLRLENDRWRNKGLLGMVGISYSPFR